jgi:SAM-dependent methyltransferase
MIQDKVNDVRAGYDLLAEEYARRIYDELQHKPRDRELLDRFADSVRGAGVTCDLGCGPGHVARYLQGRGIEVCGMDLSDGMIARARRLNPDVPFTQGDMRVLPVEDNAWAGIVAFYAIVNLQPSEIVRSLHEMLRVLQPGGRLLLSFHLGEDKSQVEEGLWGYDVALQFTFFRVNTITNCLREAGFTIDEIVEREPYAPDVEYQSNRAYIFAHRPS